MKTSKSALSTMSFIFFAILMSKVLGQVREIVIAYTYGTAWQADAYVAASQIPTNFFDMILGSAVSSAFIPVFNKFMEKDGEERARNFAGVFFNIVILVGIILSALGCIFSAEIIKFMAPGLSSEASYLASGLLKIMFPMVIFIGGAFTFVGLLQSLGEYNLPAVMSVISSVICIIYLLFFEDKFGIYGLSVALLTGWVLQFLFLLPSTLNKGFKFTLKLKDDGIKEVVKLALPVLIGTWVQPINVMINTIIASKFTGGVSAINYANKLYLIAAGVFAMAVTNYVFPKLSRLSANDNSKWNKMFMDSIKTVLIFVTPVSIIFILQSTDIIRIIYERGEFGENSVLLASGALAFYSLGMIFYALQEVMYKAFYSKRTSVIPMIISILGIIINLALSFILSKYMGINGLALSATISITITSLVSFIIINKKSGYLLTFIKEFSKIIIAGIVSAIIIIILKNPVRSFVGYETFIDKCLSFIIPAGLGIIVYGIIVILFSEKEGRNE